MVGFIVGAACVVGLVKWLNGGFGWRCGRGGCGYGGHEGWHRGWRGGYGSPMAGRGVGRRWALRWLFERLETTPGQERAIVQALDRLAEHRSALREEIRATRTEVGRAVESGLVDDGTFEDTFARHDRSLAQLRVSVVEALKTITETLDERQRRELAAVIAKGGRPFAGWWGRGGGDDGGGPYRAWA
jgi:hypothetical protein